ncbi:MAG: TetR/AcrR family transcriptional regulator [Pseudomonadota bacterium]
MSQEPAVRPRKQPVQARSRAMVETILDAAARILIEEGLDDMTTNRVSERAGIGIGSLYQYFPNKQALVAELAHRHKQETLAAVKEVTFTPDEPIQNIIRRIVRNHIRLHSVDPEMHIALARELPRLGVMDWHEELNHDIYKSLRKLFDAHPLTAKYANPDLVLFILRTSVEAIIHKAIIERDSDVRSGALEDELTRLVSSYLV